MNGATIACPKCQAELPGVGLQAASLAPCPSCAAPLRIDVFPALFRKIAPGQAGETILVEGEASCFFHPQKKAVVPCEACGRFLCRLCDVELRGRHLCPACLETGQRKGRLENLENHRPLYDDAALSLSLLPLLIWPATMITGPLAVFLAVRYWNAPSSIIPRTKVRAMLAIIIGLAQIVGWTIGWYFILRGGYA